MTEIGPSRSCLKLVIGSWDPFVTIVDYKPPYKIIGPAVDVIHIIMKQLGYCYTLTRAPDNDWGLELPNGSWTGTLGMLNRNEADMSATVYTVSENRARAVDFSEGVYLAEQGVSYMRPQGTTDVAGFIKPYTPEMWLGIFLSILLILVTFMIVHRLAYNLMSSVSETPVTNDEPSLWVFSALLTQSVPWTPCSDSVRILGCVWLMLSFILANVYRSNLMAMLIAPKVTLPFNSFQELSKTNIKIFAAKGSRMFEVLNEAKETDPIYASKKNFFTLDSTLEGVNGFFKKKWGISSTRETLMYGIHKDFSMRGFCGLYIMAEGAFAASTVSYAFPKKSKLKPKVDAIIRNLREFGITEYLLQRIMPNVSQCLKVQGTGFTEDKRALAMGDLYSSFIILASGMVISTFIFVIEKIVHKRNREKNNEETEIIAFPNN